MVTCLRSRLRSRGLARRSKYIDQMLDAQDRKDRAELIDAEIKRRARMAAIATAEVPATKRDDEK
jgi:hypothetical protein